MQVCFGQLVGNPVYRLANPNNNQVNDCAIGLSNLKPTLADNATRIYAVRGEQEAPNKFRSLFTGQRGTTVEVALEKPDPNSKDVKVYFNDNGRKTVFYLDSPPNTLSPDDLEMVTDARDLWIRIEQHRFMAQI